MLGVLYLHGFLSSPASQKAQELRHYATAHAQIAELVIPALPFAPKDAIALAEQSLLSLQQRHPRVLIIGSSLGGFYATHLAQKHAVKAALINPAVRPYELFATRLGLHKSFYSEETHELNAAHLAQLQALDSDTLTQPERLFLLLQTGDETLDYRHAAARYLACPCWLEAGGNHSFTHFIARMPMLLAWALRND